MYRKTYHRGTFKSLAKLAMLHHKVTDKSQDVVVEENKISQENSENGEEMDKSNLDESEDDARDSVDGNEDTSDSSDQDDESESDDWQMDSSFQDESTDEETQETEPGVISVDLDTWARQQDDKTKIKKSLQPIIKDITEFFWTGENILPAYRKLLKLYEHQDKYRQHIGDVLADNNCTDDILRHVGMLLAPTMSFLFQHATSEGEINMQIHDGLSLLWNYSDSSEEFAQEIAENNGVRIFTTLLDVEESSLSRLNNEVLKRFVPFASLSILHNLSRDPSLKRKFARAKTAKAVLPWLDNEENEDIPVVAALLLAHIGDTSPKKKSEEAETEEQESVNGEDGGSETDNQEEHDHVMSRVIESCVDWLKTGLENEQRRYNGFSVWELTLGLSRLAVKDANRSKIIEEKALPAFVKVLEHTDPKEQLAALECLGMLSFDDNVRKETAKCPGLVPALDKLKNSDNAEVRKNAIGVLWYIKKGNTKASDAKPQDLVYDVFISYSHNETEMVTKIHKELQKENFKIWLDKFEMKDSIYSSMAQGVKKSAVILICMSSAYQISANCQREAECTANWGKQFIPLRLEPKFEADDWLAGVIAGKQWIDFSNSNVFEKSRKKLVKDLTEKVESLRGKSPAERLSVPHTFTMHSRPPSAKARAMSCADVVKYLHSKGMARIPQELTTYDGRLLWKLGELKKNDEKYFHQVMKEEFKIGFTDYLRLSTALDDL